jgi:hypothetical protein
MSTRARATRRERRCGDAARSARRALVFALLLSSASWPLASSAAAQSSAQSTARRADGVAAIVGGYSGGQGVSIIMRSDVDLLARLRLAAEIGPAAATADVPENLSAAALDTIFGEVLIAREAERVRIRPSGDAEVARELARLESEAGGAATVSALLDAIGASAEELRELAARRAIVAAFLEANLESSSIVTTAEVERVFASGDHPFAGQELGVVEGELRALIARRNIERAVRRWISVLRARTPFRVLARYGEEPGGR